MEIYVVQNPSNYGTVYGVASTFERAVEICYEAIKYEHRDFENFTIEPFDDFYDNENRWMDWIEEYNLDETWVTDLRKPISDNA